MKSIHATRLVRAPLETVFATISGIHNFTVAFPHITDMEFIASQQYGVGTPFRDTWPQSGREEQTELKVIALVENDRICLTSDAGGTIWQTTFFVNSSGSEVELSLVMGIHPYTWLAMLVMPRYRGFVIEEV